MKQRDPIKQKVTNAHPVDRHIGQQIKIRRLQLHMSQSDLGQGVGVSFQQVQKYENGTNRVSASKLYEIAGCLNVAVATFFEGLPEPGSGDVNQAAANVEDRIAYVSSVVATAATTSLQSKIDFGIAADDYSKYRQGFPVSFIDRLIARRIGLPSQRVLDIGTGTGLLALKFASLGCTTTGVDPSPALLTKARELAKIEGLDVSFLEGRAEQTDFPDATFDVVSVATAWHWFDRAQAAREALRLLSPAGKIVIAVLEWHMVPGNVVAETKGLIDKYLPGPSKATASSLNLPLWGDELIQAGFTDWDAFSYVAPLNYSHEQWRGRVRASQAVSPRMSADEISRFDDELQHLLTVSFPTEPMPVPHRVSAVIASFDQSIGSG